MTESEGRELWQVVEDLDLPIVLTRLSDLTVEAATESYFTQLAVEPSALLGKSVLSLFDEAERLRAREALKALDDGAIDFYRTYRFLSRDVTAQPGVYVWSHIIEFGSRRYALTELSSLADPMDSPLVKALGFIPNRLAIGLIDETGVVTTVSNDVASIIGVRPEELIGQRLLGDAEQGLWTHLHSTRHLKGNCAASFPYHRGPASPETDGVQCLMICLTDLTTYCFILTREPPHSFGGSATRTAELERRLWRIAQEVRASGVMGVTGSGVDLTRFPQMGDLNARQWEVLTRLLRGERVATIATALFVSPSTIRSSLSTIYRKFKVHSQAELLQLLRT